MVPAFHCKAKTTLANVPRIYDGDHWVVERAHPTSVAGWLVLVSKTHREAIHELTPEENPELGALRPSISRALHSVLKTKKEYVFQMAEKDGFNHVHFHIIARPENWRNELQGSAGFSALGDSVENALGLDMLLPITSEVATFLQRELT